LAFIISEFGSDDSVSYIALTNRYKTNVLLILLRFRRNCNYYLL
jgi:subtilisin family serine protease